jgi:hypothetical protein
MPQTKESRFGWGSLLTAFVGGTFFGQVVLDDDRSDVSPTYSGIAAQPATEVQGFAALPSAVAEKIPSAPDFEAESDNNVIAPQPFVAAPAEPERDVYYANCSAARAARAAPVYADEPGYSRRLDRDGDGVGCE